MCAFNCTIFMLHLNMHGIVYWFLFPKSALDMSVHLATNVRLFCPLENLFAIPHVLSTMEDVILFLNTAMSTRQEIAMTLVHPAETLWSALTKVILIYTSQPKALLMLAHQTNFAAFPAILRDI